MARISALTSVVKDAAADRQILNERGPNGEVYVVVGDARGLPQGAPWAEWSLRDSERAVFGLGDLAH